MGSKRMKSEPLDNVSIAPSTICSQSSHPGQCAFCRKQFQQDILSSAHLAKTAPPLSDAKVKKAKHAASFRSFDHILRSLSSELRTKVEEASFNFGDTAKKTGGRKEVIPPMCTNCYSLVLSVNSFHDLVQNVTQGLDAQVKQLESVIAESLKESQENFAENVGSRLDFENPLKNPMILEHVFRSCSLETLRSCRLVSRDWYESSLNLWRKSAVFHIRPRVKTNNFIRRPSVFAGDLLKLAKASEKLGSSDFWQLAQKPVRNFVVIKADFPFRFEQLPLGNYFSEYGHQVTSLELVDCIFDRGELDHLVFTMLPNLERLILDTISAYEGATGTPRVKLETLAKLEELRIGCGITGKTVRALYLPNKPFLSRCPTVKTLIVELSKQDYRQLGNLLRTISTIKEENPRALNVEKLFIETTGTPNITPSVVTLLPSIGYLSCLKLDIGENFNMEQLHHILEPHSTSLKELTLYRLPNWHCYPTNSSYGVTLENLEKLHLYGDCVNDFAFLKCTPNLEVLHVLHHPDSGKGHCFHRNRGKRWVALSGCADLIGNTNKEFMVGVSLPKLEELEGDFHIHKKINLKSLKSWMPNVTVARLRLSKKIFRMMCHEWRGTLRVLEIFGSCDLDDEAITGWKFMDEEETEVDTRNGSAKLKRAGANITTLKNLRSFTLRKPEDDIQKDGNLKPELARLTDYSVTHGFLELPQLDRLEFYTCSDVSQENLIALKGRLSKFFVWEYEMVERKPVWRHVSS